MRSLILALVAICGPVFAAEDPHAHHMPPVAQPAADPHAGHTMPATPSDPTSTPAAPTDFAADRIFGADAMAAARAQLRQEHGAHLVSKVMVNTAEYAGVRGANGYRWDGEAWLGGDLNRAVLKTEGEGIFGGSLHDAEIQGLYSRAIGPYFDVQAGVRHDITPNPSRTYAVLGLEGLAPYWFEVETAAFLSDKGDVLARLAGSYEQLVTQRLVLEPRVELNLAAQKIAAQRIGGGVVDIEMGLRLRYEVRRQFAPYVGISYTRKMGETADLTRAAGEKAGDTAFVVGLRSWF